MKKQNSVIEAPATKENPIIDRKSEIEQSFNDIRTAYQLEKSVKNGYIDFLIGMGLMQDFAAWRKLNDKEKAKFEKEFRKQRISVVNSSRVN